EDQSRNQQLSASYAENAAHNTDAGADHNSAQQMTRDARRQRRRVLKGKHGFPQQQPANANEQEIDQLNQALAAQTTNDMHAIDRACHAASREPDYLRPMRDDGRQRNRTASADQRES